MTLLNQLSLTPIIADTCQIIELRLKRKVIDQEMSDRGIGKIVTQPHEVYPFVDYLREYPFEAVALLLFDAKNKLVSHFTYNNGTLSECSLFPRNVALQALANNAASAILAHNHPTGDCAPSPADKAITRDIKDALSLFDIRLLDHIIVGNAMYSMQANGHL